MQVVTHLSVGQVFVWSLSHDTLVKNNSNTPDIALRVVYVLLVTLRTHIRRRSYVVEQLRFLSLVQKLAESEVSDACASCSEKNVGSFKISMHYLFLFNRYVGINDVTSQS